MWKAIASTALSLFVVVLFLLAGVVTWAVNQWEDDGPLAQAICLTVPGGSNMRSVSQSLIDQGAVSSGAIFRAGADYSGKAGALKAGNFRIPEGTSMAGIVDLITGSGQSTCGTEIVWRVGVTRTQAEVREMDPATGRYTETAKWLIEEDTPAVYAELREDPNTQYRIVVAEGVTSWQVRDAVNRLGVLDGEVTEIPPEGSLAPDSYGMRPGDSAPDLIAMMQAAQDRRLAEAWDQRSEDAAVTTPQEALILASIIEKETGLAEERFQVASVFTNRLKQGMKLQTDPTVIYGITKGEGVLGRGLRRSELRRETPWNTYVIPALPPTPIANPGYDSIRAALNPGETDFIFFVADGTGGHAFAKTLDEHNRNVARWREIEAERR